MKMPIIRVGYQIQVRQREIAIAPKAISTRQRLLILPQILANLQISQELVSLVAVQKHLTLQKRPAI